MVALRLPLLSPGTTSGSAHSGLSHPKPVSACSPLARPQADLQPCTCHPPPQGARACLPGSETALLPSQLLWPPLSPGSPCLAAKPPPTLRPPSMGASGRVYLSSSTVPATTVPQGAWQKPACRHVLFG